DGLHENDPAYPPIAPEMPYAEELNQWAKQIPRLAGVVPAAAFSVTFSGGTPSISQFVAMPTGPELASFTVTDNGSGDTTISWAAGTFPTSVLAPTVTMNSDAQWRAPVAFAVTNGVRVKTRNDSGTLTDGNFTVLVY